MEFNLSALGAVTTGVCTIDYAGPVMIVIEPGVRRRVWCTLMGHEFFLKESNSRDGGMEKAKMN